MTGMGTKSSRKTRQGPDPLRPEQEFVHSQSTLLGLIRALPACPWSGRLRCANHSFRIRAAMGALVFFGLLGWHQPVAAQKAQQVPDSWKLVPSGVDVGDSFRLLFVTSRTRNGTNADIATYNKFVQATVSRKGHAAIRDYSTHFTALASTAKAPAVANTATAWTRQAPGVPIYWLGGDKVADDYADFYDGSWDSNAPTNETGTKLKNADSVSVFTGTDSDGFPFVRNSRLLGETRTRVGKPGVKSKELSGGAALASERLPFYGLSPVFTVTRAKKPVLSEAEVSGTVLKLTYSRVLDIRSTPESGDFAVLVDGASRTVSAVVIDQSRVQLTLSFAVRNGEVVKVSYTKGTNPIRAKDGKVAPAFSNRSVTNKTPFVDAGSSARAALIALFNATGGVNWEGNRNWASNAPLSTWHGVEVDHEGYVTELNLGDNGLRGEIPAAVVRLPRLSRLVIALNDACAPADPESFRLLSAIDFDGAYCPTKTSRIDIAFFYTPGAKKRKGGHAKMRAYIDLLLTTTNRIFSDNGVGIRLSSVLAEQIEYGKDGGGTRSGTHLSRLVRPNDGEMDDVFRRRDAVGADIVHLITLPTDRFARGVAKITHRVSPESRDGGFSLTTSQSGATLFAHELGHVLGLEHDRHERCRSISCTPNIRPSYPYSFGYVNQRAFDRGARRNTRWRTIMSYNTQCNKAGFTCNRIRYFSNPAKTFRGHRLGQPGEVSTPGVHGPANAVRALNNIRETVSRFRSRPGEGVVVEPIRQSDPAIPLSISLDRDEIYENAGATEVTFTATLGRSSPRHTDFTVEVRDGTARSPGDFEASPRRIVRRIRAGHKEVSGKFTLTPVRERGDLPECDETVVVSAKLTTGTPAAFKVIPANLALKDRGSDSLQCMEPTQRPAITFTPDSPPNPPRGLPEVERPPAGTPVASPTAATLALWTDRAGSQFGQPVRLYRSLHPRGDKNEYTFFYALKNLENGSRSYFPPGIGSTHLEDDVVDQFGMRLGAFRPTRIQRADRELIWAGAPQLAGSFDFVAEIRTSDALQVVKAAHAKFVVSNDPPRRVSDDDLAVYIQADETWSADTVHELRQPVHVQAGATLTIQAGTLIQALGTSAAIVVERGGRIEAAGTRQAPVVLTCDAPVGKRSPGCWGGLTLRGRAPISDPAGGPANLPAAEREVYGGDDPADSSGSLRFVRVEFAGANTASGSPRPAIAFHGVGSGTVIDHVQAHASLGDGLEFRGGTARCLHCVSSGARDDGLEWSRGWQGTAQYVFLQQGQHGNRGIKATGPGADSPDSKGPTLYNLTLVGGAATGTSASSAAGIALLAGATATMRNVVLIGSGGVALSAADDTIAAFVDGRSSFQGAIVHANGGLSGVAQVQEAVSPYVQFIDVDPQLRNMRYEANPDPRPMPGSAALEPDLAAVPPADSPLSHSQFLGAFGAENWLEEWTFLGPESHYAIGDPSE